MWIEVARGAGVKLYVFVACRAACRVWFVAFLASYLEVQSSQWITRFGVIELLRSLPALCVMALSAFVTELTFVGIGVAGRAIGRLAKERSGRIPVLDERFDRRKHVRGGVAPFARNVGMLAF